MAKPIEIPIVMNARGVAAGAKDAEDALEDVADSLDDLARDGDQSLEKVERSFAELADAAQRESKKAGDDLGRNIDRGAQKATSSMAEVKSEALQNASETFSSFDGSAQSFISGIQGTLGGLVAGLSANLPAAAAVAAGAVGIGLIASALQGVEEDTEEFKAKVAELTKEFIDSGIIGSRSFDGMVSDIKDLATETDDAEINLTRLAEIADTLGISFEDVVKAYTSGGQPLQDLIDKAETLRREAGDLDPFEQPTQGAIDYGYELNQITGEFRDQKDAIDEAIKLQALYLDSGVTEFETKAGLIAAVNTAYDTAAASTGDFINAESGVFDTAAYVAAMQEREQALRDYQDTLATSGLSNEAKSFLNDQGAEAAALMLAGYQSADATTRAELDRIWTEAGKQNSGTYVSNVQTAFDAADVNAPSVNFNPTSDAANYSSDVQRYFARNPVRIVAKLYSRYGEEIG